MRVTVKIERSSNAVKFVPDSSDSSMEGQGSTLISVYKRVSDLHSSRLHALTLTLS